MTQTMKLFTATCHERTTLRKLWRQTGNSSLLPAKCWLLLHVIRASSWRWPDVVAGILVRLPKFAFVLFCYKTNHLMTSTLGNSEFCFPRISMFPERKARETLRFEKRAGIPATASGHLQLHVLITCNSGQHFAGNSELFPICHHSFRNVARSWHLVGKVSLLDVMWPWTSQWMGAL